MSHRTFEEERTRTTTFLDSLTRDKDLPLARLLAAWEALDRITYMFEHQQMTEQLAKEAVLQLRHKLLERLKEAEA